MMRCLIPLLFFLGQPFWETKPPEQWSAREIDTIRTASPWAEIVGTNPTLLMYFATAKPIEEAEAELRVRSKAPMPLRDPDYLDFVREHQEDAFILAVPYGALDSFGTAQDQKRMEDECQMVIARKSYKIIGYFPPTGSDPVLRLAFPRKVQPSDKRVSFRLFIPGVSFPEREVEFRVKDLLYHGKLEM